ncbi:MAG: hypothetical protein ACRELB_19615, partial [Polyangiaceae bacterium]
MANVKGVVILNGRDYALASGGERAWGRVLERLGPGDRQALAEVIPVGWYDMGIYDRTNRALADALGAGSAQVMTDVGRFA